MSRKINLFAKPTLGINHLENSEAPIGIVSYVLLFYLFIEPHHYAQVLLMALHSRVLGLNQG